ncbi:MAG: HNH endonuclease signature motif containing protein [Acidimicrobiia bacterium]
MDRFDRAEWRVSEADARATEALAKHDEARQAFGEAVNWTIGHPLSAAQKELERQERASWKEWERLNEAVGRATAAQERAGSQVGVQLVMLVSSASDETPIGLKLSGGHAVWLVLSRLFYDSTGRLDEADVRTLVAERDLKVRKTVARAMQRVALADGVARMQPGRENIPDDVKLFVWQRDGGACVKCGAQADLEFDHVIPVTMGGSSTARNLQILCANCNSEKGGHLA